MKTSLASKIVLFVFGIIFFALALSIQNCARHPTPETLFPDVTQTPDLVSHRGTEAQRKP